ncbi:flavin reductase family protein [Paralcaligenes sp. KSB-10]|uniref:flavin reductase family protein n=1 Tax=Paralcaligenes sp. KSB-10 TaxID=2901142 RepID=UPI00351CD267
MFFDLRKSTLIKPSILNAIVAPRPIAWVSSSSAGGGVNLAPFSYFTLLTNSPPTVIFSCVNPTDRREKDTLQNIRSSKEYVINMVSRDFLEAMHSTSRPAPYGTNEFDMINLRSTHSENVKAPRVEGTPAALECKLLKLVRIRPEHHDDLGCTAVIGRIVGLYVARHLLDSDGRFRSIEAGLVARLGGNLYSELGEITELASVARSE